MRLTVLIACLMAVEAGAQDAEPVLADPPKLETFVEDLEQELSTRTEYVETTELGRKALDYLHGLDPVAYIRYASVYDNFTIMVLMQLEGLGFCEIGQGGKFVADGNLIAADGDNSVICRIDLCGGIIRHIAGTGTEGFAGDGGPATAPGLCHLISTLLERTSPLAVAINILMAGPALRLTYLLPSAIRQPSASRLAVGWAMPRRSNLPINSTRRRASGVCSQAHRRF